MNASWIDCDKCGREPAPVGSPVWAAWWRDHWTGCRQVQLDAITIANLERSLKA